MQMHLMTIWCYPTTKWQGTCLKDVREAGEDVPGIRVARDGARGLHVPHDVVAERLRQLPVAQELLHALHLRARTPGIPGPVAWQTSFLCVFGLLATERGASVWPHSSDRIGHARVW